MDKYDEKARELLCGCRTTNEAYRVDIQSVNPPLEPNVAHDIAWVAQALRDVAREVREEDKQDIRNLLHLLQAHQENTDEWLEPDDRAVMQDIAWRHQVTLGPKQAVTPPGVSRDDDSGRSDTQILHEAVTFAEAIGPLPRCKHGKALRDGAGEALEPSCGCRVAPPGVEQAGSGQNTNMAAVVKDLKWAIAKLCRHQNGRRTPAGDLQASIEACKSVCARLLEMEQPERTGVD